MIDPETLALYDSEAADFARRMHSERPYPRLDTFIASLPEGGDVLDLGCGSGIWAAYMAARGLRVDAVDASSGMAEIARARYGIKVRIASFDQICGVALYDGVWAHYSLLHARRADLPGHLAALARALRPGGRLHLTMKLGTGEARDGKQRFYSYYSEEELTALLAAAHFLIEGRERGTGTGFAGETHDFIALLARRP